MLEPVIIWVGVVMRLKIEVEWAVSIVCWDRYCLDCGREWAVSGYGLAEGLGGFYHFCKMRSLLLVLGLGLGSEDLWVCLFLCYHGSQSRASSCGFSLDGK